MVENFFLGHSNCCVIFAEAPVSQSSFRSSLFKASCKALAMSAHVKLYPLATIFATVSISGKINDKLKPRACKQVSRNPHLCSFQIFNYANSPGK